MVHFECPQCGKRLDVDAGFRGAVARCEHCGALIAVPTKAEGAPKPKAVRPAAPGAHVPAAAAGSTKKQSRPGSGNAALRTLLIALVLLALAGGGAGWWLATHSKGVQAPPSAQTPAAPEPAR